MRDEDGKKRNDSGEVVDSGGRMAAMRLETMTCWKN